MKKKKTGDEQPYFSTLDSQLQEQKRKVDFDTFDISVKELVSMAEDGLLNISPEYQRKFRWDETRQSLFVESIFLGIPIPSLFTAANRDGKWELIDGVQRLSTLIHFCGTQKLRESIGLSSSLRLEGLEKLSDFNNQEFSMLPPSLQYQFLLRPIKVTTLSDKSDERLRFDLFERLNTGGIILSQQEIRNCIFSGKFSQFLKKLSTNKYFRQVVKLPDEKINSATSEEYVLRFFAFTDRYGEFEHSVKDFLNLFMKEASSSFNYDEGEDLFNTVFRTLASALPKGINRGRKTTPVNLYEAVAVGAALAFKEKHLINTKNISEWIGSGELKKLTTGATNSNPRVKARIDFCKGKFLMD